jgi:putative methionine-R-sulfoxide reductase with GAF domain
MDTLNDQIRSLLKNSTDQPAGLKSALERVLADLQSQTGTVHLLDAKTQLLHLAAQVGLPPQMLEVVRTIPVGKGIAGQTVAQNQPVTICNLQTDTGGVAKPGARQTGVGGALCVPMRKDGSVVGAIGIGTVRPHEYTPEEMLRLERVADLLAVYASAK